MISSNVASTRFNGRWRATRTLSKLRLLRLETRSWRAARILLFLALIPRMLSTLLQWESY